MPRQNSSNRSVWDQITADRLQDINEDIDDIYILGTDRGRIVQSSLGALKVDIGAFAYLVGSIAGLKTAQTGVVVTDSATNYIEIDDTGTTQINTTWWTTAYAKIGTVVCAGWVITSINIYKPDVVGWLLGWLTIPYNTVTAKSDATVYQASNKWGMVVCWRGPSATMQTLSDASNPPTTVVAQSQTHETGEWVCQTAPILPNMYRKTQNAATIYFYENI